MKRCFRLRLLRSLTFLLLVVLLFSTQTVFGEIQSADRGVIELTGLEAGMNMSVSVYPVVTVQFDFTAQVLNAYSWHPTVAPYAGAQTPEAVAGASAMDFYDGLAAYVQDPVNGIAPLQTVSTSTGEVTIPNLELGTYLLLVSGGTRFYRPIAASIEAVKGDATGIYALRNASVRAKAVDPQLTGTINAAQTADGHVPSVFDTASIGELLTIDIYGDVPQYPAGSAHTSLSLSHATSAGMSYDPNSLLIFGVDADGNETLLTSAIDFTLTEDAALGTWRAALDYNRVKQYTKLHGQFFVKLNDQASIGEVAGNESVTTYTYTSDPSVGTEKAKSVTLRAYTYGLQLSVMYQAPDATRPLPSARYQVRRSADEEATALNLNTAVVGGKSVFVVDPNGTNNLLMSDSEGGITLYGLGEGNYYLVEIAAPYGFNQSIRPQGFTLAKQGSAAAHLLQSAGNAVLGVYHLTATHTRSVSMPRAGGTGEILLYGAGLLLLYAAAWMWLRLCHIQKG